MGGDEKQSSKKDVTTGTVLSLDAPWGTEVWRWRTAGPHKRRIRLLRRDDGSVAVFYQGPDEMQMRGYDTEAQAVQVARQLREASGESWLSIDPASTHWWG